MILLLAVSICALALPTVATAQVPATNASGGQYLPATPGGGGNQDESDLAGGRDARGRSGFKAVGTGEGSDGGGRIGLALPGAMLASLLVAGLFVARGRRPGNGPVARVP